MNIPIKNIAIIFGIIGSLYSAYLVIGELHSDYAKRDEVMTTITEIRLHQVKKSISSYQDKGLATLTDKQQHEYNLFLEEEKDLNKQRNGYIGFSVPEND